MRLKFLQYRTKVIWCDLIPYIRRHIFQWNYTDSVFVGLRQNICGTEKIKATDNWDWHGAYRSVRRINDGEIPWASLEPNDYGLEEDCGAFSHHFQNITDVPCGRELNFVCQFKP